MNLSANSDVASASSPRDNPCFDIDPTVATLIVFADDEHSYMLPYAQFLYAELIPNPVLEVQREAPPEKLTIHFVAAEVEMFGSGFRSIVRALQKYELKFVKSAGRRYAALLKTHIAAVAITLTKETP
jgi:hypothetical protein